MSPVLARLVQHRLAQLHAPLFVVNALGFPLLEKLHARVAAANGVDHRSLHRRALYDARSGRCNAVDNSKRISRMASLRQSSERG